jgi:seryl-tRNA synthetase
MLDMKWIRENRKEVEEAAQKKGMAVPLSRLLKVDEERGKMRHRIDDLREARNKSTAKVAEHLRKQNHLEAEAIKAEVRERNAVLIEQETRLAELEQEWKQLMLLIPNIPSKDSPIGATDLDNVVLRTVGKQPEFAFEAKDHLTLGEQLELFDIPRGVKVAGTRNYFLKGAGLYLHRAVQQLAIDLLSDQGYTVMDVPLMLKEETLENTGFFPHGKDQTYELTVESKWLAGTSEASLISYFGGEVIDLSKGPIRLAAVSNCFRREAGSAGRDVRGLYRVHQFAKVEQVILCRNDHGAAEEMLTQITEMAEHILHFLELPYRIVAVCTGDMGLKNHKQFDIETWMPSRNAYGETHSASSLLDFQARRSGLRFRNEEGRLAYCYTLNNTAVATPRILIPLLENHQQADGSIYIPRALRPYMRGADRIT